MKVCHITSAHPYNDTRIFLKECQSISEVEGYTTYLVAPNGPNKTINEIKIYGLDKKSNGRLKRMIKDTYSVYKKALEIDADIYHFHDPELIPAGLKLKKAGKVVIYDVHEDVPRQILSKHWIWKELRKTISWLFERYENYAVKKFDGIVTATPFINNRFSSLGVKSININNYPILSELHVTDSDLNNKERAVCYIGGIGNIRGVQEMVEAIGYTNVNLLLAGKFNKTSEREDALNLDGWNKVVELGFLNRNEVKETMSKSVAGLVLFHPLPNHIDAQPNKMFEYMSAGTPVIASNFSLWKEIIEGNQCGICVDPLNTKEIANAIQWLVDHPAEAKQMGENGRKAIEEKYNWDMESAKLIKLYKELKK